MCTASFGQNPCEDNLDWASSMEICECVVTINSVIGKRISVFIINYRYGLAKKSVSRKQLFYDTLWFSIYIHALADAKYKADFLLNICVVPFGFFSYFTLFQS